MPRLREVGRLGHHEVGGHRRDDRRHGVHLGCALGPLAAVAVLVRRARLRVLVVEQSVVLVVAGVGVRPVADDARVLAALVVFVVVVVLLSERRAFASTSFSLRVNVLGDRSVGK